MTKLKKHGTGPLTNSSKPTRKILGFSFAFGILILMAAAYVFISSADITESVYAEPAAVPENVDVQIFSGKKLAGQSLVLLTQNHRILADGKSFSVDGKVTVFFGKQLALNTGSAKIKAQTVEVFPNFPDAVVALQLGKGAPRNYPGKVQILRIDEKWTLVNTLPLDTYVAAVTDAETTATDAGYLELMTVVVRTRAKGKGPHGRFMFCDRTCCMVYKGEPGLTALSAAQKTTGSVLAYENALCPVYFHASCGGSTRLVESGIAKALAHPALSGVEDLAPDGRAWCRNGDHFAWKRKMPQQEFNDLMEAYMKVRGMGEPAYPITLIRESISDPFVIYGETEEKIVDPVDFRMYLGRAKGWNTLLSPNFAIINGNRDYIFSGRGFGHGVGLCQAGALERIRKGQQYPAVLQTYFPRTQIRSMNMVN
jgi:stage II sporulation protein D